MLVPGLPAVFISQCGEVLRRVYKAPEQPEFLLASMCLLLTWAIHGVNLQQAASGRPERQTDRQTDPHRVRKGLLKLEISKGREVTRT